MENHRCPRRPFIIRSAVWNYSWRTEPIRSCKLAIGVSSNPSLFLSLGVFRQDIPPSILRVNWATWLFCICSWARRTRPRKRTRIKKKPSSSKKRSICTNACGSKTTPIWPRSIGQQHKKWCPNGRRCLPISTNECQAYWIVATTSNGSIGGPNDILGWSSRKPRKRFLSRKITLQYSALIVSVNSSASVRPLEKLTNADGVSQHYYQEGFSLPLANCLPFDRNSIHEYERTPRLPLTATTIGYYDDMWMRNPRSPTSKVPLVRIRFPRSLEKNQSTLGWTALASI